MEEIICDAGGGEDAFERMAEMFGPGHADQAMRMAVQACWRSIPKDRRTLEELEKQVARLTQRALRDLREDSDAFGSAR